MRVDLEKRLVRFRESGKLWKSHPEEASFRAAINDIIQNHKTVENRLEDENHEESNDFDLDLLETDRIYHIDEIRKLCVQYRLRFLETHLFKGEFPEEAINEIRSLENSHNTTLNGFRIIAPSKLFNLENADDPILFAPIGGDYYYKIAKWGRDVSAWRKMMVWPFRNLETLAFTTLLISALITWMIPDGLFSKKSSTTQTFFIFLFMFKMLASIVIFYGFALGKNFNTAIWDSRYLN